MFGAMLFLLNKNHHKYLNDNFKKFNINVIQGLILLGLSESPNMSQKDLSNLLNLSKGSIAKYVADLEEKDFISRRKLEDNKRKYKIILNQKAIDLVPDLREISKDWENQTGLNNLNSEFVSDFKQLLDNSNKLLEGE